MNILVCSCLYVPLIPEQGADMSYMTVSLSDMQSLYLTLRKPNNSGSKVLLQKLTIPTEDNSFSVSQEIP
jgi:hypothetical protein